MFFLVPLTRIDLDKWPLNRLLLFFSVNLFEAVYCLCEYMCVCMCVRRLYGAVYGCLQPLSEVLMSCLHSRLSVHCHVINTHLLHVLHHGHSLLDCFTTIRVSACFFLFAFNSASFMFSCYIVGTEMM